MEAAAAVIAVITFSLQTTKFIYQTVEEIRDGPAVVKELVERARTLEGLLQQLQQLAPHSERCAQVHHPSIWKPLETKVSQCSSDLQEIAGKLKALDLDNAKHHLDRAWKRVRVSLKEKDLARISDQMQRHVADLGTQLLIVSSHLAILRDFDERQQLNAIHATLNNTNTQLSLQSIDLKSNVVENTTKVQSSFTKLAADMGDSEERHEERSHQMLEGLRDMGHLATDRTLEALHLFQQGAHKLTEEFATRLDKLQSMSKDQHDSIIDRLRRIELQGSVTPVIINSSSSNNILSTDDPDVQPNEASQGGSTLSAAIDRLCNLASSTAQVCYSQDAEDIIDDLGCVLDAILHPDAKTTDVEPGARKRKWSNEDEFQSFNRNIKRVRGLLSASCAIEIVENNNAGSSHDLNGRREVSKRSTEIFDMVDCTAVVSLRTERYIGVEQLRKQDTLRGSISILPRKSNKRAKILAYFLQRLTKSGFDSLNPMLSFHSIVPDNAEIFVAVKTGNEDMMLELFNAGKASLRDCDSEGRSLLHFAVSCEQLLICRFLIAHGADVDSFEKIGIMHAAYGPPLYQLSLIRGHWEGNHRFQTSSAIRRCLLESGADPLSVVDFGRGQSNSFEEHLNSCHPETLSLYLKHGRDYINLEIRDSLGRTPLLRILEKFRFLTRDVKKFDYEVEDIITRKARILVNNGADVDTRDDFGRGCLHSVLNGFIGFFGPSGRSERSITIDLLHFIKNLANLIRMGANTHTVDNEGFTVTEYAHSCRGGRLWEEALRRCDLDVQAVYTRDHRHGRAFSEDVYAPDSDHPRVVHTLDRDYYDIEMDPGALDVLLLEPLDDLEQALSRFKDFSDDDGAKLMVLGLHHGRRGIRKAFEHPRHQRRQSGSKWRRD